MFSLVDGSMQLTDAEFWGVLAENLAGLGCMPTEHDNWPLRGLCSILSYSHSCEIIGWVQKDRLKAQMFTVFADRAKRRRSGYFWRAGDVKPRIAACRKLMCYCLEKQL